MSGGSAAPPLPAGEREFPGGGPGNGHAAERTAIVPRRRDHGAGAAGLHLQLARIRMPALRRPVNRTVRHSSPGRSEGRTSHPRRGRAGERRPVRTAAPSRAPRRARTAPPASATRMPAGGRTHPCSGKPAGASSRTPSACGTGPRPAPDAPRRASKSPGPSSRMSCQSLSRQPAVSATTSGSSRS